jgi:hypothetical protein
MSWSKPLPSRVIDVGPHDGSRNPCLHISKGETGSYLALSHCWGLNQHFTTTKETLHARLDGFVMSDLPKTFQDAVFITRQLGYRYIWIDALCIIQDDLKDWEMESACMAQIYHDSVLTIAASASRNDQMGCFFPRTARQTRDISLRYSVPANEICGSSDTATFYVHPSGEMGLDPLSEEPLNSRGWTLQERTLSRRTIHFAKDQLFWECQTTFMSEDGHWKRYVSDQSFETYHQNIGMLLHHGPDLHLQHEYFDRWKHPVCGFWVNLVEEFTKRSLTKEKDVFPSLAGIADLVQRRTNDRFLAGLWENTLYIELLWVACKPPRRKPADWRAPSWSWAALSGACEYVAAAAVKALRPSAEFLATEASWTGQPFTSGLKSGKLLVSGLVVKATYTVERVVDGGHSSSEFYLVPENGDDNTVTRYFVSRLCVFDQSPPPPENTIFCLCICSQQTQDEGFWGPDYYVLLLEPTQSGHTEYRRIGVGQINAKPGVLEKVEKMTISIV